MWVGIRRRGAADPAPRVRQHSSHRRRHFIAAISASSPLPFATAVGSPRLNLCGRLFPPLVVQLLFVYYISRNSGAGQCACLVIGFIVIGIHYSTYMSESYRAGIDAVPPGQFEAATALSLPPVRTFTAIVLPQALRATIPSLGNYAVAMFKDTPFLFAISVVELVTAAKEFGGSTFAYTEAFTLAGIIFLIASYPTSLLIQRLDRRLATY